MVAMPVIPEVRSQPYRGQLAQPVNNSCRVRFPKQPLLAYSGRSDPVHAGIEPRAPPGEGAWVKEVHHGYPPPRCPPTSRSL